MTEAKGRYLAVAPISEPDLPTTIAWQPPIKPLSGLRLRTQPTAQPLSAVVGFEGSMAAEHMRRTAQIQGIEGRLMPLPGHGVPDVRTRRRQAGGGK